MHTLLLPALLLTLPASAPAAVPDGWRPVEKTKNHRATKPPRAEKPTRSAKPIPPPKAAPTTETAKAAPAVARRRRKQTRARRRGAITQARYRRSRRSHRYRRSRRYRRQRRYRRSRRRRRSRRSSKSYLKDGGLTFTLMGGYSDRIRPAGPYEALQRYGLFGYTFGWSFSPYLHLGVSVSADFMGQRDGQLGRVKGLGQLNVTSDLTVRLIAPSDRRYVVPFLQLGLGVTWLSGSVSREETGEGCDGEPETTETTETTDNITLARGGIFQVGGGVEFYLTRWLALGVRALYRLQVMSGLRCAEGPNAICDPAVDPNQQNLHVLSTDAYLTFHFWSL